jgi:hypothetical protein
MNATEQTPDFTTMNGPELVAAYTAMLETPIGKQLLENRTYRPVTRFSDLQTGIKRCQMLASSIKAVTAARRKEEQPEAPKAGNKKGGGGRPKKGAKTNRQKLIDIFMEHLGKPLSQEVLLKAVYGASGPELRGPLNMVLKGVTEYNIATKKIPYKLEKTKTDGKIYYTFSHA